MQKPARNPGSMQPASLESSKVRFLSQEELNQRELENQKILTTFRQNEDARPLPNQYNLNSNAISLKEFHEMHNSNTDVSSITRHLQTTHFISSNDEENNILKYRVEEKVIDIRTNQYRILENNLYVTNGQLLVLLQEDPDFRKILTDCVTNFNKPRARGTGVLFEVRPFGMERTEHPFEFVLIITEFYDNVMLDMNIFREHLLTSDIRQFGYNPDLTRMFYNRKGNAKDAILVAPKHPDYPHLAENQKYYIHLKQFLLNAKQEEIDSFWITNGFAIEKRIKTMGHISKLWWSTSATGIYYLHTRLENTPQNYHHTQYKEN